MAIATESSDRHAPAGLSPAALSTGVDRSRQFALARRHSIMVRALKVLLPACAILVMSSYAIFVQHSVKIGNGELKIGPVAFSSDVLTMHNPQYEGYGKDGSRFSVSARTAEQDVAQKGPIRLTTIEGSIVQANNVSTSIRGTRGIFDTDASELELLDGIEIKSSDGMAARLSRAKLFMKESRIVSAEPVEVEMSAGTLRGNSMVLLQKTREVTFSDGVHARLKPQSRSNEQAGRTPAAAGLIGASDAPVDVTAPTLTVNDGQKTAVFTGNVRAEQEGSVLTARVLEVVYDGGPGSAGQSEKSSPGSGRVKRILARDDVVMTRGSDRVVSAAAEFDAVAETTALTGGVVFTSGPDREASADRADLDFKAETALLTGAVTVSQGPNMLSGRRLFVDRKNGTMQLSSPAEGSSPAGRITSRFRQPQGTPSREKAAPDGDAGGWRFQTDPNAPIDIEADTLDVDDKSKTATFRGNVHVEQGDFRIRTVELVATYTGQAGAGLMPSADPGAKNGTAQLQRVQARRKVVVTSKQDQSATGDWADFDVKANTVVLGGDVTLTQGRNVIRGPRLVIDMTTGQSRMETSRAAGGQTAKAPQGGTDSSQTQQGSNAPGAKGWPAGACGGRMCAVFYPSDIEALGKRGGGALPGQRKQENGQPVEAPQAQRQGEGASSWTSTTVPAGEAK